MKRILLAILAAQRLRHGREGRETLPVAELGMDE